MNLPNKLTVLRVILVPVFVFFVLASFIPYNNFISLIIFALASFTDLLDGKIARKKNLVTNFGKFMDPLADKLLVVTALLCLLIVDGGRRMCENQVLGLLAVIIIVAREFTINSFRVVASDSGKVIAASMWGKFKTATTMVAICLMLVVEELSVMVPFVRDVTMVIFWIAVTLTIVSLVDYIMKNKEIMADAVTVKKEKKNEEQKVPMENPAPKFDTETGEPLN